jgi:hypothetical protein
MFTFKPTALIALLLLTAIVVKGKWGYVDANGSWVMPLTFSHAQGFWHGLAWVAWNESGEYGYVNKTGEVVWKNVCKPAIAD